MEPIERRRVVAANVRADIIALGSDIAGAAEAAHLTVPELTDRIYGRVEFTPTELVQVGGFLHVRPETLLRGVAA